MIRRGDCEWDAEFLRRCAFAGEMLSAVVLAGVCCAVQLCLKRPESFLDTVSTGSDLVGDQHAIFPNNLDFHR